MEKWKWDTIALPGARSLAVCPLTMLKHYMHKEEVTTGRQSDRDIQEPSSQSNPFGNGTHHHPTFVVVVVLAQENLNNQKRMGRNFFLECEENYQENMKRGKWEEKMRNEKLPNKKTK